MAILLAAIGAATIQTTLLAPELPARSAPLLMIATGLGVAMPHLMPATTRLPWHASLAEAWTIAVLLAAAWPSGLPLTPLLIALPASLVLAHALGGPAVNPFPPMLLALVLALLLVRLMGMTPATHRVLVPEAMTVAALWFGLAGGLAALGLFRIVPMLAFGLPVALACAGGEVPASGFAWLALAGGFLFGDPRHLPATASGRALIAALAGLGSGLLLMHGAPPVAIAFVLLPGFALTPWVEERLMRTTPKTSP